MTSHLTDHIGFWMRLVSNHVSARFDSRLEAHGITVSEWVILREIYENEGVPVQKLADTIGFTKGAVSKIVVRLEEKNLVTRTASPEDGRAQVLRTTARGHKLIPLLAAEADENDKDTFGFLPEKKRDELMKTLKEIARKSGLHQYPTN